MKSDSCVGNLIKTKYLDGICKVVAGKGGLNKQVSWVHILEIKDVLKECVDGNEMVLTTGICFTDKETAVNFFKELISLKSTFKNCSIANSRVLSQSFLSVTTFITIKAL